ncbi:MAG TPA: hypothetical protein ENK18_22890 [Deltaproteobacteria bacterium]|nr:hypothetical protein [Deltaproteobacteria bacterium]
MSTLPLLLLTLSCQTDPAARAATTYINQLQPLLQENGLLAEHVLFQAAAIYNKADRQGDVAKAWSTSVVPLAEHLYDQSTFIEPPEQWVSSHDELVEIWGVRAQAYRNISEGLQMADQEAWESGRLQAQTATQKEELWFDQVNTIIAPMGFLIDAYP